MTDRNGATRTLSKPDGTEVIELPTELAPLTPLVRDLIIRLYDDGLAPWTHWGHRIYRGSARIMFGINVPTEFRGDLSIGARTGRFLHGVLFPKTAATPLRLTSVTATHRLIDLHWRDAGWRDAGWRDAVQGHGGQAE